MQIKLIRFFNQDELLASASVEDQVVIHSISSASIVYTLSLPTPIICLSSVKNFSPSENPRDASPSQTPTNMDQDTSRIGLLDYKSAVFLASSQIMQLIFLFEGPIFNNECKLSDVEPSEFQN